MKIKMLKVIQDLGKVKTFQCYCMYQIRVIKIEIKNGQNDRCGNSSVNKDAATMALPARRGLSKRYF